MEYLAKYDALVELLNAQGSPWVSLSLAQISEAIPGGLPPSAYTLAGWWANDSVGHVQSRAWLAAGWRMIYADLAAGEVDFSRDPTPSQATSDAQPSAQQIGGVSLPDRTHTFEQARDRFHNILPSVMAKPLDYRIWRPSWNDADPLDGDVMRLRRLLAQAALGNPLASEVASLRMALIDQRVDGEFTAFAWLEIQLVRALFSQGRDAEAHEILRTLSLDQGTEYWIMQLSSLVGARMAAHACRWEEALDRLCHVLVWDFTGGWNPDYVLRALYEIAVLEVLPATGFPSRADVAQLALFVADQAEPWRGTWYNERVQAQLRELAAKDN